ncbi:hypothetical protein CBS101457_001330 [Exobasidium rhododendri]|nr:hypothetical protein CBS101457_001330 [Exobasidium rhododendri]
MVNSLMILVPAALASQAVMGAALLPRNSVSGSASASAEIDYSFGCSLAYQVNQHGVCRNFGGLDFGISSQASFSQVFGSGTSFKASQSFSYGANSGFQSGNNAHTHINKQKCAQTFLDSFTITMGDATCSGKDAVYSDKGWKCNCSSGGVQNDYELYLQAGDDVTVKTFASYKAMASQEWDFHFYASADADVQVITLDKPTTDGCGNGKSCTMKYNKTGQCQS